MLCVVVLNRPCGGFNQREFEFHVGQKDFNLFNQLNELAEQNSVKFFVQADCDELDAIRSGIGGIRMARGPVVRWVGEDARFIVLNLGSVL